MANFKLKKIKARVPFSFRQKVMGRSIFWGLKETKVKRCQTDKFTNVIITYSTTYVNKITWLFTVTSWKNSMKKNGTPLCQQSFKRAATKKVVTRSTTKDLCPFVKYFITFTNVRCLVLPPIPLVKLNFPQGHRPSIDLTYMYISLTLFSLDRSHDNIWPQTIFEILHLLDSKYILRVSLFYVKFTKGRHPPYFFLHYNTGRNHALIFLIS